MIISVVLYILKVVATYHLGLNQQKSDGQVVNLRGHKFETLFHVLFLTQYVR